MRLARDGESGVPRLVVVIVIDQLRYDLLARYRQHFGKGGFARFLDHGARFTNARYLHGTTDTCPGHAVITTGTWGAENGVVANQWHDGKAGPGTDCTAGERDEFARRLLRPTIGEVIVNGLGPDAKIFAASGKDTAARLMGGTSADGVFWPRKNGNYTTWKDGDVRLPIWVRAFNAGGGLETYASRPWKRLLPASAYALQGLDDEPAERRSGFRRTKFPHYLSGDVAHPGSTMGPQDTPFADEVLAEFGIAIIRAEGLGEDAVTDYLALSFSASDVVTHAFGPDSHESMDTILRLDRQLEVLLNFIDRRVRLDRALVVLTADHGSAPLPEVARRHPWGAGAGRISESDMDEAVERSLTARFGPSPAGKWLAFHDFPNVYLREDALRARGIALPDAEMVARDAVAAVHGVRRAVTRAELARSRQAGNAAPEDEALLLSFHPKRSGHVVYQVEAYEVVSKAGSNHGSDWDYDTHVPLMWLGPGLRPGEYSAVASPADVAPTIFAVLGLEDPGTSGRVLREMFVDAADGVPAGR
jgi:arylsulfatase A-like enzyme